MIKRDKQQEVCLAGMVLAAGSSSRLGTAKQMLQFRGDSLVRHTVKQVMAAGLQKVLLVTGAQSERVQHETIDLSIDIFFNKNWSEGQGASLSAGLKYISEKYPDLDGVLIVLCDQPFISSNHISQLIEAYRPNEKIIVVSGYSDTFGVPVLFDRYYFKELLKLKGDEGGKSVLKKHVSALKIIPFPQGGIDIDEAGDLQHL